MHSKPDPIIAEIRAGLARHGLTQEQLATQLGLSRAAVGRRFKGEVSFNLTELRTTAKLIHTTPHALIALAESDPEDGDAA